MNRNDVTEMIIEAKVKKGIKWEDVAKKVGLSKEWVTAGCLGQMTFDAKQAKIVAKTFGLPAEAEKWLQVVPYKGSLPTSVPTDPLIYRFYETRPGLRHYVQGTDPRRIRRRHHERDRLQDGPHARAERRRRPGQHRDVGQVPVVQDLLIWNRT